MSDTKVLSNKKRENYIKVIKENYGDLYDFSKSNFNVPYDDKVEVICKICGNSQKKRISDLIKKKAGCAYCRIPNMQKGFYQNLRDIGMENFIKKANSIYNGKYTYDKTSYKGMSKLMKMVCPIHGDFYKTPNLHIYNLEECPICRAESNYSSYEAYASRILDSLNYKYIPQFIYKNDDYLKNKPFDFYIESKNLLIEIDGPQHRECCWDMTKEDLIKRQEIDRLKTEKAKEAGFNIIRIPTNTDIELILKEELDK